METELENKLKQILREVNHQLGSYLFLGMGNCNGHKVVIGIGYTLIYCIKKSNQFVKAAKSEIEFTHISVIKTGEKKPTMKLEVNGKILNSQIKAEHTEKTPIEKLKERILKMKRINKLQKERLKEYEKEYMYQSHQQEFKNRSIMLTYDGNY